MRIYIKMTENNYFEVPCQRNVSGANFSQGVQDYTFSIGAPNCWTPSKSFFRVEMTLTAAVNAGPPAIAAGTPLVPSLMTAYADNAVGNLFDNTYMRAGQQDISSVVQYAAQASALDVRLNNTLPWLQSMGSSTAVNQASFMKRLNQVASNPGSANNAGPQLTRINTYGNREIYRPTFAINGLYPAYATAVISIAAPLTNAGANPQPVAGSIVSGVAFTVGAPPTTPGVDFINGMPSVAVSNGFGFPSNTGGPVLPGDILVVQGIEYEIASVARTLAAGVNTDTLVLVEIAPVVANTTDWFIVRNDAIRDKQASSSVYSLWQPPIGIFKYSEELGAGDYRIQLNPNTNFNFNAVECRNPLSQIAASSPYQLVINDIRFYCYVEKKMIPDTVRDLYLNEMLVQSKPYSSNLQFSVPPSTSALTIFFQDGTSGSNPQVPPSMFKVMDNTDLTLKNIQITYANITKPSTNWDSSYGVAHTSAANTFDTTLGVNKLEQRYHDSYEESGLDLRSCGCESFYDWLQRGPFFHYSFERDVNNKSTEVQLNLVFNQNIANNTRVFIVAHFRKTVQITTANGLVVNVSTREV